MVLVVKNPHAKAEDPGLIPGLGRSPGEGNDYSPQYSYLENSMNRGAYWATVYWLGLTASTRGTPKQLCIKLGAGLPQPWCER